MLLNFLTRDQALEKINRQLDVNGIPPISERTLFRLRNIYVGLYPRSRHVVNNRLDYNDSTILYLYFLASAHARLGKFRRTEALAIAVKDRGEGDFSDQFKSFSDVDSFFLANYTEGQNAS